MEIKSNEFEKRTDPTEGEEITLDENKSRETIENKIEESHKRYTHSINGVMVSDEEWENHLVQGKDAE